MMINKEENAETLACEEAVEMAVCEEEKSVETVAYEGALENVRRGGVRGVGGYGDGGV